MTRVTTCRLAIARYRLRGQNVVEYGAIIATIVLVVLLAVNAFGTQLQPWFAALAGRITTTGT
jgi:Flp pilus assembly pilin Flp